MGPIRHMGDVSVFDRVVMNIIAVDIEIPLITKGMFPGPALPDAPASIAMAGIRQRLFVAVRRQPGLGEVFFDRAPAFGIIGIVQRQGSDGVQVIGQHDQGVHPKRPALPTIPKRRA